MECTGQRIRCTGALRDGVGKQDRFRIQDGGEAAVHPGWINLGQVGNIHVSAFQTACRSDDVQPVCQRVLVPVNVIEGAVHLLIVLSRGPHADLAEIDTEAPQIDHTAWRTANRIARKLNVLGIKTALDLALTNPAFIRKNFSVVLERTVRELNGESCLSLEEAPPTKQQIVCSRSFGVKITEYESLRQAICQHAERASEKLRKEHQYCRHISVFIKTSPFAIKEPYYGNVATEKLLTPTQDTRDIIAAATTALERIWRDGHRYAKAGVMLNDFTGSGVSQLQLFDERPPRPHSAELMRVLDGINNSGLGKVWFAGRGMAPEWQMKREMLSPAYTTRWSDIPAAKLA